MNTIMPGSLAATISDVLSRVWVFLLALPFIGTLLSKLPSPDDQNIFSLFAIFRGYRDKDFPAFLKAHREAVQRGHDTGDYVPGVCNYYRLMADLITLTSGPFWHFVPMTTGKTRKECHEQFHHTIARYLHAKAGDKILEFGCGFGEIGRQAAKITGASVTGLTMADEEIAGGNERIKKAGLEDRCKMVQGNYNKMPFEAESFDKVFGVYTLKYASDLDVAIGEAARVLKPGGRFVSYEIIITDKYDPNNKEQRHIVENISRSTCMPPLWPAEAFRAAATKAGLVAKEEVDLCAAPGEGAWYSCFTRTGIHYVVSSNFTRRLVQLAETLRILPKGFSDFYQDHLVHPATDFVNGGKSGIINGALMMVWEKP